MSKKKINIADFDVLYTSSLKQLYKDRFIEKSLLNGEYFYSLTPKGYSKVITLLKSSKLNKKAKSSDNIRLKILKNLYY